MRPRRGSRGSGRSRETGQTMTVCMRNGVYGRRGAAIVAVAAVGLLLAGCSSSNKPDPFAGKGSPKYTRSGPIPKGGGRRHVGRPYTVAGRRYHPSAKPKAVEVGVASWYGPRFHRRMTANGEWFDMNYLSAAHKTMPLPSYVRVTNLDNGRTVVVRVNDRGPFVNDRVIDLSRAAADRLGYRRRGKARVKVEYLGPAPLGDDRRVLARLNRMRDAPRRTLIAAARGGAPSKVMVADAGRSARRTPVRTAAATPPPEKVRPVPASAPPAAGGGYYVQVASYSDPANAEATRRRLADMGPVEVRPVDVTGMQFWRVRLGPFASREDAEVLRERVAQRVAPDARILMASN